MSDQETLEYMLHVRCLSSIILIRKYHNHRIIALKSPDCQSILVHFLRCLALIWIIFYLCVRTAMPMERLCRCTSLRVSWLLHASNTQNSHARLKYDLRHALIMEETHLFDFDIHLYLKLSTKYSNIKSTSMKISDLSVNSQKTLKWLFTVDCQ